MEKIPNLYDGINFNSLPKSIYDELITNSNDRGFTVTKNDKGETITIDGEYLRPFFMYFSGDYNFYLNLKHYDYLERRLKNGNCFDKDYNKLNVQNIYPFYKYYNDGFIKGYNEFENSLKNHTALFNITNEQIAFKIYSRVTRSGYIKENDGGFKLVNDSFSHKEIDEKICKEYSIKHTIKIYEENFFKSGFEGGEFYKAWELILNNPTVFEPIFKANIKTETTPEPQKPQLKQIKANKSLLFDGKELNLSERYKIANKVLDIDNKIRILNIKDLEKYQLLAYILGCDKDNARNIMNGSYNSKDRDLTTYFDDLNLKK